MDHARRRKITLALANPAKRTLKDDVLAYIHGECQRNTVRSFLDWAAEPAIQRVESLLRIN